MSSELRCLSGAVSPAITCDTIRQRNTSFLRKNLFITPSQLHGHRIAAIFAGLVTFFRHETKPRPHRFHALRVLHYAELLRHETVIYEEYRPLASLTPEGSYMRLRDRVREAEALGVDDDIETRASAFERAVLGFSKTYIVEEMAWTADIELGELQWWKLLSHDVQVTEENIRRLSHGQFGTNELREPIYGHAMAAVTGTCHLKGTIQSSMPSNTSGKEMLERTSNKAPASGPTDSDAIHQDAIAEACQQVGSPLNQDPSRARVRFWPTDTASSGSEKPRAAAPVSDKSAYQHVFRPLAIAYRSDVDHTMEANDYPAGPPSQNTHGSGDRGEEVHTETEISSFSYYAKGEDARSDHQINPLACTGLSFNACCSAPAKKEGRAIGYVAASSDHSLRTSRHVSASTPEDLHGLHHVPVRLRDVWAAQQSLPGRSRAPLSQPALDPNQSSDESSDVREGHGQCQSIRPDKEELATLDVWRRQPLKRTRTDERITELENVLVTTMHNAQVVYRGLREANIAAHRVASLGERHQGAIELQHTQQGTTNSPVRAINPPFPEVPLVEGRSGKGVNGCELDPGGDQTVDVAAVSVAFRLHDTRPAPARLMLDRPSRPTRRSGAMRVQACMPGCPAGARPTYTGAVSAESAVGTHHSSTSPSEKPRRD